MARLSTASSSGRNTRSQRENRGPIPRAVTTFLGVGLCRTAQRGPLKRLTFARASRATETMALWFTRNWQTRLAQNETALRVRLPPSPPFWSYGVTVAPGAYASFPPDRRRVWVRLLLGLPLWSLGLLVYAV